MAPRKAAAPEPDPRESQQAGPSFEEALERLETIVEELEGGSLTLEQSIARYEEGMKLSRRLTQTLDQAEKRIERLVESEAGTPATEPMELGDEDPPANPAPPAGGRPAGERRAARNATEPARRSPPGPDELPF